jgi:hypothetical protein
MGKKKKSASRRQPKSGKVFIDGNRIGKQSRMILEPFVIKLQQLHGKLT